MTIALVNKIIQIKEIILSKNNICVCYVSVILYCYYASIKQGQIIQLFSIMHNMDGGLYKPTMSLDLLWRIAPS